VIQIAGTVIDLCFQYRNDIKDGRKAITRLMGEVRGIRTVLEGLDTALEEERASGSARLAILEEIMGQRGLLRQCYEELEELKNALELKQGWRSIGRALKWPLTKKDIEKTLQRLQRLNALFGMALCGDGN
jgi:hypothetical protein